MYLGLSLVLIACSAENDIPSTIQVNIPAPNVVDEVDNDDALQIEPPSKSTTVETIALIYAKGVFSSTDFGQFSKKQRETRLFYREAAKMSLCDSQDDSKTSWASRSFIFVPNYESLVINESVIQNDQAIVYVVESEGAENKGIGRSLIAQLNKTDSGWCVASEVTKDLPVRN